jgi:hypothetical protein
MDKVLRGQVRFVLNATAPTPIKNHGEHSIRPLAGAAYAAATCLKFAGCEPQKETRDAVFALLRSLTHTHLTGGGKTDSGQPWGDHWQSALWAYEAAFAGWLLWDELPADMRAAVVKMVVHEADRFIDLSPPYSEFLDTKSEEVSWNSLILVLAGEMLPNEPNAKKWRERGIEYTIASVATRSDKESNRIVHGKPLRHWVKGANIHDDFTMENHGFVHPDYMTTISQNLTHALVYKIAGVPVPPAIFHNAKPSYELLKFFTLRDGSLFYPNGTDWSLHHLDHTWNMHVLAERLLDDPEASALADCALDTLEKMQARHDSGRLYVPGEYTTYPVIEQHSAFLVASGLIAAKLWPAPAKRIPLDAVWRRLEGTRVFDDGRLFVSRTRDAISSFGWGLRVMGQTIPFTFDPILLPLNRSYVGLSGGVPEPSAKAGSLGLIGSALEGSIEEDRFELRGAIVSQESGATSVTASGQRPNGRHSFSFTALPNGRSVYMERLDGKGQVAVGGMLSLNEDPRWVYGVKSRTVTAGDGWINVDNRLGVLLSGIPKRPVELREHMSRTLFLNPAPVAREVAVIVTLPNATLEQTQAAAAQMKRLPTSSPMVTAIALEGLLVVTNFDGVGHTNPNTSAVAVEGRTIKIPVNGLSTRVLRLSSLN